MMGQTMPGQRVYIGFFWLDKAEVPVHRMASLDKDDVVSAAKDYLVRLKVKDAGWETFLLTQLSDWDGLEISSNTADQGKIILMSTLLGGTEFK